MKKTLPPPNDPDLASFERLASAGHEWRARLAFLAAVVAVGCGGAVEQEPTDQTADPTTPATACPTGAELAYELEVCEVPSKVPPAAKELCTWVQGCPK